MQLIGEWMWHLVLVLLAIAAILVPLLVSVAFLTYAERKVMAAMQLRRGPNIVGPFGLLQPFADAGKLLLKETIIPTGRQPCHLHSRADGHLRHRHGGMGRDSLGESASGVWTLANINVGILYLFAVSSLGVYGIIMAGWASNSRYAFLGALRSAAQMVSYEVSIGFVLVAVLVCVGSLNLADIVRSQSGGFWSWYIVPLFPLFVIFFISALAETNRAPFDLPEAESELVSGYNVEYSAMTFALFFMGEYANMVLLSGLATTLFLGGWLPPFEGPWLDWIPGPLWFLLKTALVLFVFIWVRATFPRYRYDQLMRLGWKVFLPLSLAAVVVVAGALQVFGWLPR